MLGSSPFGGERPFARPLSAKAAATGDDEVVQGLSWEPSLICIRFAIYALLAGAFASSAALVAFAPEQPWRIAGPLLGAIVAIAGWLFLSTGRHATSVGVLSIGSWLTITAVASITGGVGAPIVVAYPVMIIIIGWVHGARTAAIVTILTMAAVVGFVAAEALNALPVRPSSIPSLRGVILIVVIALSSAMIAALVRAYLDRVAALGKVGGELARRAMDLERQQADLCRAQTVANTGSWVYDPATSLLSLSAEACRIFGVPDGTAGSYPAYLAITHAEDRRKVEAAWQKALQKQVLDIEHRIVVGPATRWIRQRANLDIAPDGSLRRVIGVSQDISDRKASEEEIRQLAFYDTLTGLPNRRLLRDRLRQALASSMRSGTCGALLLIDLDSFKLINDTRGHDVGDQLLKLVADRLGECVRESDTIARLGGDEFVVILEGLAGTQHEAAVRAESVTDKILSTLGHSIDLEGLPCVSTPSIGIALFAGREATIDELLRRADVAMYQAKHAGRNTMRFFDPEMQTAVAARIALESDLRTGIEQGQLLLHYQAQVDEHGRVSGVEALLRWQHPVRGIVLPAEFISIAEDTGLIVAMGCNAMAAACEQLAVQTV